MKKIINVKRLNTTVKLSHWELIALAKVAQLVNKDPQEILYEFKIKDVTNQTQELRDYLFSQLLGGYNA